jgi:8-amino-7-oxononanoate synthase
MPVLDFTSSLYLGFRHPSHTLGPWESLTTGGPAALAEPEQNRVVAQALADLQGCERGVLAPSTLHLFWDLFGILSRDRMAIYLDAGTYPIARWGVERAAARGAVVRLFPHHDASALRQLLRGSHRRGVRPVIVTDGFCPAYGRAAPVREYLACAKAFGGLLIIDDTQALGILGHSPGPAAPYGKGGGGMLRWSGFSGPEVLVIASLAKGFGAPVGVLSGSSEMIGRYEADSEVRVHCSPPSAAAITAAGQALKANANSGDALRQRLAGLVSRFRGRLKEHGISTSGALFPMQTLFSIPGVAPEALHQLLLRQGVKTVLHGRKNGKAPLVSFIITTRHSIGDIEGAAGTIANMCRSREVAPPERASRQRGFSR